MMTSFLKPKLFLTKALPLFVLLGLLIPKINVWAQDTVHYTMPQVIQRGLDSSKTLHISQAKIDAALEQFKQAKTAQLPNIKASFAASEALILTQTVMIDGLMKKPMHLPSHSTLYIGTLSASEPIFAGHKIQIAKKSADLLHSIANLNAQSDSEQVVLDLIKAYINLYKIDQNLTITTKEITDVQGRLDETIKFKNQGLATKNDVLRFQLQKAKAKLKRIDLQNARAVANYGLCLLLGEPEGVFIKVDTLRQGRKHVPGLATLIDKALLNREEIGIYRYKGKLAKLNIKKAKGEELPTLGIGVNAYYLNPNSQFIPPENSFLVPATVGLNLSWNISSLYQSKHKISTAHIKHREIQIAKSATIDHIKNEVNRQYRNYLKAIKKINVLETAVAQAKENDRIMELKYQNQLATTTDRIDAQTMFYQSLTKLNIAKADALAAYYKLQKAIGIKG